MKQEALQVVWFKRDLRVEDNAALARAAERGPVLPLYIMEPDYWREPDASHRHWRFAAQSIAALNLNLADRGQPLVIRFGEAVAVLDSMHKTHGIATLWSHMETGNHWTFMRDRRVAGWCRDNGVPWHEPRQFGVIRPLPNRDGWAKAWDRQMRAPQSAAPIALRPIANMTSDPLPSPEQLGLAPDGGSACQKGGREAGLMLLESFMEQRGRTYRRAMSSPLEGADACSRLSPHLTWGTLSIREVAQAAWARQESARSEGTRTGWTGAMTSFLSRLHWHCHFIQKLEDAPRIEWQNLHPAYDGLRPNAPDSPLLAAWQTGQTGLPFLDACMRSLEATGWLNFRMRAMVMAVASYHLWLDWRAPGLHLARMFTDYEPGIHWSQVQMQSGTTGMNTIRVYNPVKQGLDQDPDGLFIARWVPELAGLPAAARNRPWAYAEGQRLLGRDYPHPVVEPAAAAKNAKDRLWAIRKAPEHRHAAEKLVARHASRAPTRRSKKRKNPPSSTPQQLTLRFDS